MVHPAHTTASVTRYVVGRFHDDRTFEPYPKTRSFATALRAHQYVDDEIGPNGYTVFAVTEIAPGDDGPPGSPPD